MERRHLVTGCRWFAPWHQAATAAGSCLLSLHGKHMASAHMPGTCLGTSVGSGSKAGFVDSAFMLPEAMKMAVCIMALYKNRPGLRLWTEPAYLPHFTILSASRSLQSALAYICHDATAYSGLLTISPHTENVCSKVFVIFVQDAKRVA